MKDTSQISYFSLKDLTWNLEPNLHTQRLRLPTMLRSPSLWKGWTQDLRYRLGSGGCHCKND